VSKSRVYREARVGYDPRGIRPACRRKSMTGAERGSCRASVTRGEEASMRLEETVAIVTGATLDVNGGQVMA